MHEAEASSGPGNDSGRTVLRILVFIMLVVVAIIGTLFAIDRRARSDNEVRVIELPFLGGPGAITAGRIIFVHEGRAEDADLLANELVHVCQWEEGGLEFLWDYTTEYVANLAELKDTEEAYREISFEEEARAGDNDCDLDAFALPDS